MFFKDLKTFQQISLKYVTGLSFVFYIYDRRQTVLAKGNIIYIEETLAQNLAHEIDKFKDRPTPAIILIPGRDGSTGMALDALKAAVERAVGTNILGD